MNQIFDLFGIGIGPFNLGLAALSSTNTSLKCLFIDQNSSFNWHKGMMITGTKLQVPFHADLVTLADPRNRFSFLSYLQAKGRLFRFTIREEHFPLRKEYNDYCKWVADQLDCLRFGLTCIDIDYNEEEKLYSIFCEDIGANKIYTFKAKNLVLGIGSSPYIPSSINKEISGIVHAEHYLTAKPDLLNSPNVTIVGSGQSAAEIYYDLLLEGKRPYWFTRSPRIFPMDYSKFALEMTSPDYIKHFYYLAPSIKSDVLNRQAPLYKGINKDLIAAIYEQLYEIGLEEDLTTFNYLYVNTELRGTITESDRIQCKFCHLELQEEFIHETNHLILATGYHYCIPQFIKNIKRLINWDPMGRFQVAEQYYIDANQSVFVQNAEMHTHGYNTPDLGMGPYRNAIILNAILKQSRFQIEDNVPFQGFGIPKIKQGTLV